MLSSCEAIVLQQIKYKEGSLIVKFFTDDFGLITCIVKGFSKSKGGKKLSNFQPLSILNIEFFNKKNAEIHQLKTSNISAPFKTIPFDIIKSSIAFFIAEVLSHTLRLEQKNERLFAFITSKLKELDGLENTDLFLHQFLLNLTSFLGFYPDSTNSKYFDLRDGAFHESMPFHSDYLDAKKSELFSRFLQNNEKDLKESFSNSERTILLNELIRYFRTHLENFGELKSLSVLEQVFRK